MWDRDGNARLGGIAGCKIEEAYVGPSKMRSSDSLSVPLDFATNRFVARTALHTG